MKYVITGSAGKTATPLIEGLLAEGHIVKVIGRDKARLAEFVKKGAIACVGSVQDKDFLEKAFASADAAYCMYPTDMTSNSLSDLAERIAQNYHHAIQINGIRYVVNLSSIGAHLADKNGPVAGVHRSEMILNTLKNVNIRHLRAAFFYTNLFGQIGMIQKAGIMGSSFSVDEKRFPVSHYSDVARIALDLLSNLSFEGHKHQYISSAVTGTTELAQKIGAAIGNPTLSWIRFTEQDARAGMMANGFPELLLDEHLELFRSIDDGSLFTDFWKNQDQESGISVDEFAKEFDRMFEKKTVTANIK